MNKKERQDWIRLQRSRGFSEHDINDYLKKQGYKHKVSFKPTALKLFIPILILILLFTSHHVNSKHLDNSGDQFCNMLTNFDKYRIALDEYQEKNNDGIAQPERIIELQKEMNKHMKAMSKERYNLTGIKSLILGNTYIGVTRIYRLNPLFPSPCETVIFEESFTNRKTCRYYIEEETKTCFDDFNEKYSDKPNSLTMLYNDPVDYKPMNNFLFIFHSLLLVGLIYFLICLISYGVTKLSTSSYKIEFIVTTILFVLAWMLLNSMPTIAMYMFLIVFASGISFIKKENHRKTLLYTISIILILALIAGIFLGSRFIDNRIVEVRPSNRDIVIEEYHSIKCENMRLKTVEEGAHPDGLNPEMICGDPTCIEICQKECSNDYFDITQEEDYCICGCYK